MRIKALTPQSGTRQRVPGHKTYQHLLRKFVIDRVNQMWMLDTTDIPIARGFVHPTAVVNVAKCSCTGF
jgi:putative transposase